MKKKNLKAENVRLASVNMYLLQNIAQLANCKETESAMQKNVEMSTLDMKMQESNKISSEKAQGMNKDMERDWLIGQNQKNLKKLEKQVSSLTKDNEKLQKTVSKQAEQIKTLTKDVSKVDKISHRNDECIKLIKRMFTEAACKAGNVPYDASFKKVVKTFLKSITLKGINANK